ncbi:MAG: Murein DD-endopeptidase MepM [Bacteroidetes bacterium ADurb.Bin416]|jgi:murein DD-endopeptidase MepM/ murein hydrolase activator NlpD|nr:MAG: Murein DD-endopeptidase MepM [Bacteroidetes bacterium ADurb.Bin416]
MSLKKKYHYSILAGLVIILGLTGLFFPWGSRDEAQLDCNIAEEGTRFLGIRVDTLTMVEGRLSSGTTLSVLFSQYDVSNALIDKTISVSKDIFDPRRFKAGQPYYAFFTDDSLSKLRYLMYGRNTTDFVVFDVTDTVAVYVRQKPIKTIRRTAEGVILVSLWNNIRKNGHNPALCYRIADLYAWQIDFFGIQEGDYYKVIYDELVVDDSVSLDIGRIHGAVFNHNHRPYYAIPFEQDSVTEYYDEKGQNLRKAFLKAPLRFSRISSRFTNSRRHPILRISRPHHGVDYAAPAGTPVVSIGHGTVIAAGYERGGGNYVKIRHNSNYSTTYMHLSRFATGIRKGAKVEQGQRIGYVGSTGLSTGPHLDFRVYRNGQPIDPLRMESPPVNTLNPASKTAFNAVRDSLIESLSALPLHKQS